MNKNDMEKIEVNYKLNINTKTLFGDWSNYLSTLFATNYFYNLMVFLNESYKNSLDVRPLKKNVFKAFTSTNFKDLRVVILSNEPYSDYQSNGLALANPSCFKNIMSPELKQVANCIEREIYEGLNINFDPTLENWTKQGVLLLNSSLTVNFGKKNNHIKIWKEFTRHVIKTINREKTSIFYVLLGKEAIYYKKYINSSSNYVLIYENPGDAIKRGKDWKCPYFKVINRIIEKNNGKEFCIKW